MFLSLSLSFLIYEMGTAIIISTYRTGERIKGDHSGQALSTMPGTEWIFEK